MLTRNCHYGLLFAMIFSTSACFADGSLNRDRGEILTVIESFAVFADRSAFEYLGQLFADEVTTDYSSAFGGEPATMDKVSLMQQWADLLPGFDLTRHDINDIEVDITGKNALATAAITASHYLGKEGFWQISGSYRFELEHSDGGWKIKKLSLLAESESGSRDLLAEATRLAPTRLAEKLKRRVNYQNLQKLKPE